MVHVPKYLVKKLIIAHKLEQSLLMVDEDTVKHQIQQMLYYKFQFPVQMQYWLEHQIPLTLGIYNE